MTGGAVATPLTYISRNGELAIETDDGTLVATREAQRALLAESQWSTAPPYLRRYARS